jgi:outer membrane receptor for ferric coprogen and ferric-rhodotorulic acid
MIKMFIWTTRELPQAVERGMQKIDAKKAKLLVKGSLNVAGRVRQRFNGAADKTTFIWWS